MRAIKVSVGIILVVAGVVGCAADRDSADNTGYVAIEGATGLSAGIVSEGDCRPRVHQFEYATESELFQALDSSDVPGIVSTLFLYGPDSFDEMRQYPGQKPRTLESEFQELKGQIEEAFRVAGTPEEKEQFLDWTEQSYTAYLNGDEIAARRALDRIMSRFIELEQKAMLPPPSVVDPQQNLPLCEGAK
nr:hypothetical protein [uncultured Hyphomonas sp.]